MVQEPRRQSHGTPLIDVLPAIGHRPIAQIKTREVLDILREIEKRKAYNIAKRVRSLCGQVFLYGVATYRCESNPAEGLGTALKKVKTTHYPALEIRHLPELMGKIAANDQRLFIGTRRAQELIMLTFVRPGELRQARWEEIDLEKGIWNIPADKMKMRKPYIVPLCRQAIEILKAEHTDTHDLGFGWVFPSQRRHRYPMSENTLGMALKRMGYKGKQTAHGFRAVARTNIHNRRFASNIDD